MNTATPQSNDVFAAERKKLRPVSNTLGVSADDTVALVEGAALLGWLPSSS